MPHGNRQIKNPENAAAFAFRKKVGNKRGSNGHKSRFADADQCVAEKQFPIGVGDRRQQCQPAPEHSPQHDNQLARVAVSQRADKGRGHHVEQQKGAGQISDLGIGEMKFALHQRLHRKQHRSVDVVEEVQRRQDDERGPGIEFALGHLAKEYNMAPVYGRSRLTNRNATQSRSTIRYYR